GTAALSNPTQLLGIDVTSDSRRIAGAHYEWGARRQSSLSDRAVPEACIEAIYPYEYQASQNYFDPNGLNNPGYDPCIAHGFAFSLSVDSWRGDPSAAQPSSTANVHTHSDVLAVDTFGHVTSVRQSEPARVTDDLCVLTTFATPPPNTYPRVTTEVTSRTVYNSPPNLPDPTVCSGTLLAKDTFAYDQFGHVTSHDVQRYDDL